MSKFHRLTLLSDVGIVGKTRRWRMRCECGTERTFVAVEVRRGHTKSCGCLAREWNKGPKYRIHRIGMTDSRTYSSWRSMKARCYKDTRPRAKNYFGKVTICDRWMKFANFLSDMGDRPDDTTLDRIKGNLGYSPDNCRWATNAEQAKNKTTARLITFRRETKNLVDWAKETGIGRVTITNRIRLGWTVREALTTPIDKTRRHKS